MKLSRKKAIELCIEAWTIHAKTGCKKSELPEKHQGIDSDCWFCEYNNHYPSNGSVRRNSGECVTCPYLKKYGHCNSGDTYFSRWGKAKTPRARKKYAKLFLGRIKTLK
jgi:hypothetical protein